MTNEQTLRVKFHDCLHLRADGPAALITAVDAAVDADAVYYINDRGEHLFLFGLGDGWPDRPANLGSDAYCGVGVSHGSDAASIGFTRGRFSAPLEVEWAASWPRGNPLLRSVGALPVLHRAEAELLVAKLAPMIDQHQPAPAPAPPPEPKLPSLAELLAAGEKFTYGHERARAAAERAGWVAVPVDGAGRVPSGRPDQWGRVQFQAADYGLPLGLALNAGLIAASFASGNPDNVALAEAALIESVASSDGTRPLLAIASDGTRVLLLRQNGDERLRKHDEPNPRFGYPDELVLSIDRAGEPREQVGGPVHADDVRVTFRQGGTMIVHDYSWPDRSPLDFKKASLPVLESWRVGHVRIAIEKALAAKTLQQEVVDDVPSVKPKARSRAA